MPIKARGVPRAYAQFTKLLAKRIGIRIQTRRAELSVSQCWLREQMQLEGVWITRSQLSRLENGQRLANAAELFALGRALKVSLSWLLTGSEERVSADGHPSSGRRASKT